jgi:hypothetical protein
LSVEWANREPICSINPTQNIRNYGRRARNVELRDQWRPETPERLKKLTRKSLVIMTHMI